MIKKRVVSVLLTVAMSLSAVISVAASTQEQITDVKARQEAAESDLADTKSRIGDLESKKSELETYLTDLHTQLTELGSSLSDIKQQISDKELELEMTQAALGRAREQEAKQYEDMKLRIRYMYESGNDTSILTTLLAAESVTEFLNRAECIAQLSEYDRKQLNTYKETKEGIELQEQQISADKQTLVSLKAQSEEKQNQVTQLAQTTDVKIGEYTSIISQEELNASSLQDKISQQKSLLQELNDRAAAEKRAAEEKAAQEAAVKAAQEKAAQQQAEQQSSSQQSGTVTENDSSSESTESSESQSSPQESEQSSESSSEDSTSGSYLGTFKLTAYCACPKCCGKWANGITASGTTATQGRTVAMSGVPFGTQLLINGNVYTVEDRGTPYGHVDVFFSSHSQALSFGLQYAEVYRLN